MASTGIRGEYLFSYDTTGSIETLQFDREDGPLRNFGYKTWESFDKDFGHIYSLSQIFYDGFKSYSIKVIRTNLWN
jgi:hypothetical protein